MRIRILNLVLRCCLVVVYWVFGGSIDFGASYKLNDKLRLSLNVIDLGFIRYSNHANKLSLNKPFEFNGGVFDVKDQSFEFNLDDNFEDSFHGEGLTKYNHWLTSKVYMGAEYSFCRQVSVGALSKTSFLNGHTWEDFVISANMQPLYILSCTVAYNIYDPM